MNEKRQINWSTVKSEYIAGGISQRKLAEKYGIPYISLRKRAEKENWVDERDQQERKVIAKVSQKTVDSVANNAVTAMRIRQKLLDRLEKVIDDLPEDGGTNQRKNENGSITEYKLKDLASAWKDLTEGLIITEENPNEEDSGFTEALKGTASASWAEDEE